MEELGWDYSNAKLYSLFRDNHFIKYDEEPPILGRDRQDKIKKILYW